MEDFTINAKGSDITMNKEDIVYTFYTPPKVVGGYRLGKELNGSIQINLCYKPNFIHRFFMKVCLGWYWFDQK